MNSCGAMRRGSSPRLTCTTRSQSCFSCMHSRRPCFESKTTTGVRQFVRVHDDSWAGRPLVGPNRTPTDVAAADRQQAEEIDRVVGEDADERGYDTTKNTRK